MRTKIIAKAVIFNQNGEVLMLRRSRTDERRPGEQDFPGGGVEPGEDLTAAVSREIFEEAGLYVDPGDVRLFFTKTEIYNAGSQNDAENVIRLLFWARVDNPKVKLSFEHDDYHWIEARKVPAEFPHPFYGVAMDYGLKHDLFGRA